MSKLVNHPTSLPQHPVPTTTVASEVLKTFTSTFPLSTHHFKHDAVWRDTFALTDTLRTFYTPNSISLAWNKTSQRAETTPFVFHDKEAQIVRLPSGPSWLEAPFSFETETTTCSGFMSLVLEEDGEWKIWVLRTVLEGLKGMPDVDVLETVDRGEREMNGQEEENHFDCIVIGGGQAGLSQGGRLKALGISCVVLDKYQEVGDSWKTRYGAARLHTTREYAHLPFDRTFPTTYQEWLAKDDLAKGYQEWVAKYDINIWTKTTVLSGSWDKTKTLCTLRIRREDEEQLITSSYVVIAGGAGGQIPKMPSWPSRPIFKGVVMHSAEYQDASQWKGKHGIVVGTANTGHDIADDMLTSGLASITMLQRGSTYVLPVEHYKLSADLNYNPTTPTTLADRRTQTQTYAISDLISQSSLHHLARKEPERFDSLERAGFKVERYGRIIENIFSRNGGHYVDVGTSAKISSGLIKIKQAPTPPTFTKTGLRLETGEEMPADIIVFATGFEGNMQLLVEEIFGAEVAEEMGGYWGLDEEGEVRGLCSGEHRRMWYHGGTIGMARYYSRFLALRIKAEMVGMPVEVYLESP